MSNTNNIINKIIDYIKYEYNRYTEFEHTPLSIFTNIVIDYNTRNYLNLLYDLIGLIGFILLIFSYIYQIIYVVINKKFTGLSIYLFIVRYISIILIAIYAYTRQDYSIRLIISLLIIIIMIYYIYFIFLK